MHTILTIDDDSRVRNFLVHSLSSSGYRVLTAKNGLEGLLTLEQEFVDLVLLDFDMPGLTGANIIQLIFCFITISSESAVNDVGRTRNRCQVCSNETASTRFNGRKFPIIGNLLSS